jgi:hypothetical protein
MLIFKKYLIMCVYIYIYINKINLAFAKVNFFLVYYTIMFEYLILLWLQFFILFFKYIYEIILCILTYNDKIQND